MDAAPQENSALPLDELAISPEWVKAPAKTFERHSDDDRERRSGPPPRDRRARDEQRRSPPQARARFKRTERGDRRGPPPPQPQKRAPERPAVSPVEVTFIPEEKGFAAMIEAMKQSTRAYALFDIAKLILNKPERHLVKLARKTSGDGARPSLFTVTADQSVFLSEQDAVRHVFRRCADKVIKEHKTPVEPPRGNFTFVNRCGVTGVWLGPPNYHEYLSRVVRHHQQRLGHMPFDQFKSRIQTVRDEAAVKAWIDSMSFKTEFECVCCGTASANATADAAPPKLFASRVELEKHFVENHLGAFIEAAPEVTMSGPTSRALENPALLEAVRVAWEAERRYPLKTANELRPRLQNEGFHSLKSDKGVTYITRIRAKRFEALESMAPQIQEVVRFIRAHDGCRRKELVEHFVEAVRVAEALGPGRTDAPGATPTQTHIEERVLADLHWLIGDGYVVELYDGRLWAMKDKPPAPPRPPASPPANGESQSEPIQSA